MACAPRSLRRTCLAAVRWAVAVPLAFGGCDTDNGTAEADQGWLYHGGDAGSTKYSPLTQINTENVLELEIAWRWRSPDNELMLEHQSLFPPFLHEVTPVVDDGVMYVSTSYHLVVAIEAATGRTIWTYDPGMWQRNALRSEEASRYEGAPPNWGFLHRGVSYWREEGFKRVYHGTGDGFLISLDANTGQPDPSFGDAGIVDLTVGLSRPVERGPDPRLASMNYGVNSPPIVCGGVLVMGSTITDGVSITNRAPGDVRGFDLRTGEQLWRFNTVPRGSEYGTETWEEDSWRESGSANVWTPMSCDPELGYVYLPVGSATNDHYGGDRPGDNLFSQSIVAVNAHTGERVWHFQTVHHGVWDYDPVAAPVLGDIVVDGQTVRAVMQTTKQGFLDS